MNARQTMRHTTIRCSFKNNVLRRLASMGLATHNGQPSSQTDIMNPRQLQQYQLPLQQMTSNNNLNQITNDDN